MTSAALASPPRASPPVDLQTGARLARDFARDCSLPAVGLEAAAAAAATAATHRTAGAGRTRPRHTEAPAAHTEAPAAHTEAPAAHTLTAAARTPTVAAAAALAAAAADHRAAADHTAAVTGSLGCERCPAAGPSPTAAPPHGHARRRRRRRRPSPPPPCVWPPPGSPRQDQEPSSHRAPTISTWPIRPTWAAAAARSHRMGCRHMDSR